MRKKSPVVVLSIAGYDPSSGAGITADIKTAAAHHCYAVTCITSLTVQSTRGVRRVEPVARTLIARTLEELAGDFSIAAVKIGMLGSVEAVRAVVAFLKRHRFRHVVLDPVLRSSSGAALLDNAGTSLLRNRLLPLVHVVTPNIDEAGVLTGLLVRNRDEMLEAAGRIHQMGARSVIVTGGHLSPPVDLLSAQSGKTIRFFPGKKIHTRSTHGTGCAFAMSLACRLALGDDVELATAAAKKYVAAGLKNAKPLGKGKGPIEHFV
ncbi:MAG TPA: bifunctional hydroxymethylpyrimidine kinase/phosphomethylpyrimidine kinase [Candidatus Angelobacter sp.]|nr:bifunctional hydroxymethylpyrimidine kinase/phosphomethylpyrimidine kinase [Candidatus Angelobacter sp.]